jgi:hypothetical protein
MLARPPDLASAIASASALGAGFLDLSAKQLTAKSYLIHKPNMK